MSTEETINDLRAVIVENRKQGRPADHGIDRDKLRDAVRTLRSSRTLDTSKTPAGKSTRKSATKKATISQSALDDLLSI